MQATTYSRSSCAARLKSHDFASPSYLLASPWRHAGAHTYVPLYRDDACIDY